MTKFSEFFLNIVFPRRCVSCGKVGAYFCKNCIKKIDYIEMPFCPICQRAAIDGATHPICKTPRNIDGLFVLSHYKGPIKAAVKLLKYQFVSDTVETLTDLLIDAYPKYIPKFDMFTSTPLFPKRFKLRGFNQAELLANSLGRKLKIPVNNKILIRVNFTKPQVDLRGDERRNNIRNSFICRDSEAIKGKYVGLIDDVSTTGATLFECAKVLKSNGANIVWGIVLAHGN